MLDFKPSEVQLTYLQSCLDVIFFGGGAGGGKTWASLVDNLQGVHDRHYFSVFFRTTTTEIDNGLWLEAKDLYHDVLYNDEGKFIGKAHINEQKKTITFPSGARTTFAYLELDKHADAWYGSEITKIYFEEFQFRSYYQFDVLRSRNRSKSTVKCQIRGTLNPDPQHFVYEFIKPFLDEEYLPRKELSGKARYFLIVNDVIYTDWDKESLKATHGKNPQSYTYIPATVDDNDYIDPSYRDRLDSMSERKRKQLLLGSWAPVEDSGLYFNRNDFQRAKSVPLGCTTVRGYDTANTGLEENQTINKKGDFTVGIKMSKSKDGLYYIHGMRRYQLKSGPRDQEIVKTAKIDGISTKVVIGVDAGAAGKFQYQEFVKFGLQEGIRVDRDPTPVTRSKLDRAEPFITAVQQGLVYIVPSSFEEDELQSLEAFFRELELFDGERSSGYRNKWDDIVDACTSAFNYLAVKRVHKISKRNQLSRKTTASELLERNR